MSDRNDADVVEIEFDRSGLISLWLIAAVTASTSLFMMVNEYVFLGVEVAPWFRVTLAVLGFGMALWFLYAATERALSRDPAIRVKGGKVLFHVNPGRRLVLSRDEIVHVTQVVDTAGRIRRWILGSQTFTVETIRPEGVMASAILVGGRSVKGDLLAARNRLVEALR